MDSSAMGGIIPGMNLYMFPGYMSIDNKEEWNLIFENEDDKQSISIRIDTQKLVQEAVSLYMIKSERMDKCKFIFNNKELFPGIKICQSGLTNFSKIIVKSIEKNLIFEDEDNKQSITIRISE